MTGPWQSRLTLLAVVLVIGAAIYYLESHQPGPNSSTSVTELTPNNMPTSEKEQKFAKAKELVTPTGFINTAPLKLSDVVGRQVILVDFWTYSCINCQRTLPYLNAWHDKYKDQGLTIVGVHTPEFEFEQKKENVQAAVDKYAIKYPIVLDNNYATWQAYGNRYWPRKYLIDIDGYIVYDHIGEGAYEETEQKIQELLQERAERLHTNEAIAPGVAKPTNAVVASRDVGSPEVYFGSQRNELLHNGTPLQTGIQNLPRPDTTALNQLFLVGQWNIQPEYAENGAAPATILFRYKAKNVYMVASAKTPVTVSVIQDGKRVDEKITIQADQLYTLIENDDSGEHTLELIIESSGLKAFTFTFG